MTDLSARLARLYTGAVADILDEHGLRNQCLPHAIRPLEPSMKVAGPVFTIRGRAMPPGERPDPRLRQMDMLDAIFPRRGHRHRPGRGAHGGALGRAHEHDRAAKGRHRLRDPRRPARLAADHGSSASRYFAYSIRRSAPRCAGKSPTSTPRFASAALTSARRLPPRRHRRGARAAGRGGREGGHYRRGGRRARRRSCAPSSRRARASGQLFDKYRVF